MKTFAAVAVAILMSSGMAVAQDTSSTTGADHDPSKYLAGPNISKFYTDETRTSVRVPAEFKKVWDEMNDVDRADIKKVCSQNRDVSYNPLCTNVKGM